MQKILGFSAPYMLGVVLGVSLISTSIANKAAKISETKEQEYIRTKKEHIKNLEESLKYVYYTDNTANGTVTQAKLTQYVYTNIFDVTTDGVIVETGTTAGEKVTLYNADSNKYIQKTLSTVDSSNILKQNLSGTASLSFDASLIRKNQVADSYQKMKQEMYNIYSDIIESNNYEFLDTLPSVSKDAWGRDFTYTKIDKANAQLSFNLPWDTDTVKILPMNIPLTPDAPDPTIFRMISDCERSFYYINSLGELWVTGRNQNGQLGLSDQNDRLTWEKTSLTNVKEVFVACNGEDQDYGHAYALKNDGTLWVAGGNGYGQLGKGSSTYVTLWSDTGLSDVKTVVTKGYYRAFVVTNDGNLWVTGYNASGQLGTGSNSNQKNWYNSGLTDVVNVFASNTNDFLGVAYAITGSGSVYATGRNDRGQLGINNSTNQNSWQLSNLTDAKQIALGEHYNAYAVTNSGDLYVVGLNTDDQLGLGAAAGHQYLWADTGVNDIASVYVAKRDSAYALANNGDVWVTGLNYNGQLGLGNTTNQNTWVKSSISDVVKLKVAGAIGSSNICAFAINTGGELFMVGRNRYGGLGTGDTDNQTSWIKTLNEAVADVIPHYYIATYAITTNGRLFTVGHSMTGSIGLSSNTSTWYKTPLTNVNQAVTGFNSSGTGAGYILTTNNELYAAGTNGYGQLGVGNTSQQNSWVKTIGAGATIVE